jgi:NAD-dependent deacetylase
MDQIEQLRNLIQQANDIVFFGGAGVSTESNIPDFRSATGIYKTKNKYGISPEVMLSRSYFLAHTETFYAYYKENLVFPDARPNLAHHALATLEKQGKLKAIVTQNVDHLHQKAGSTRVYELHGSAERNYCMHCHAFYPLDFVLQSQGIPTCKKCGHIVKPDVVLYEEGLDMQVLQAAIQHIAKADLLIVGGTSLNVYPAAGLIDYFRGKNLVIINKEATNFDRKAQLVIQDSIGKVLSQAIRNEDS